MNDETGRKKWTKPVIIPLGKLSDVEKNAQLSEEQKQQLIILRNSRSQTEPNEDSPEGHQKDPEKGK